jgi:hypothetical protein
MPIIYAKSSALVPQGDRTTTTFPSGLVRVDQSFVGLTAYRDAHFSQLAVGTPFPLDESPAIDGLFIFPAPQETRDASGFTTYRVSGYGRTNEVGTSSLVRTRIRQKEPFSLFRRDFSDPTGDSRIEIFYNPLYFIKEKTIQKVILSDQEYTDPNETDFIGIGSPIPDFADDETKRLTEKSYLYLGGPTGSMFENESNYDRILKNPNWAENLRLFKRSRRLIEKRDFGKFIELKITATWINFRDPDDII